MTAELGFKIATTPQQQLACNMNICKVQIWNTYVLETVRSQYYSIIIPQMIKFYVSAHNDSLSAPGGQWCDKPGSFIPLF